MEPPLLEGVIIFIEAAGGFWGVWEVWGVWGVCGVRKPPPTQGPKETNGTQPVEPPEGSV